MQDLPPPQMISLPLFLSSPSTTPTTPSSSTATVSPASALPARPPPTSMSSSSSSTLTISSTTSSEELPRAFPHQHRPSLFDPLSLPAGSDEDLFPRQGHSAAVPTTIPRSNSGSRVSRVEEAAYTTTTTAAESHQAPPLTLLSSSSTSSSSSSSRTSLRPSSLERLSLTATTTSTASDKSAGYSALTQGFAALRPEARGSREGSPILMGRKAQLSDEVRAEMRLFRD